MAQRKKKPSEQALQKISGAQHKKDFLRRLKPALLVLSNLPLIQMISIFRPNKIVILIISIFVVADFSFAQPMMRNIQDSLNIQQMTEKGFCSVSDYSVYKKSETLQGIKHYNSKGLLIETDYFAMYTTVMSISKATYEYNGNGKLVKSISYANPDTSKKTSWYTLEYDKAGNKIGSTNHTAKGETEKGYSDTIKQIGNDIWTFHYKYYKNTVSEKKGERIHHEGKNRVTTDEIKYFDVLPDSIKEINTYYDEYDDKGRLIEWGVMNYNDSMNEYAWRHYDLAQLYQTPQVLMQMQLDRKFHGEKDVFMKYYYDSLGRLSDELGIGDSAHYVYNDKNQLVETQHFEGKKSLFIDYEYDQNGLLIHRTEITNENMETHEPKRIEYERIYKYSLCK